MLLPPLLASILISTSFSSYGAVLAYLFTYFWELSTAQISGLTVMWAVGIVLAFLVTPIVSRGRDKRNVAVVALSMLGLNEALLIGLRLVGLFPSPESAAFCSM